MPASGAFDASTPADAQTKPCRVSAITSGPRARTMRTDSRRIDLDVTRVAVRCRRARARAPTARPRRGARRGPRPWRRPSARARRRPRPRASWHCVTRLGEVGARARPPAGPRAERSSASRKTGDAQARVRLVAPGSRSGARRSSPRARARTRSGPASIARPCDELRGELEREALRLLVVAADERRPRRAATRRASPPRASAARRRPARRRLSATRSASDRASLPGRASPPSNDDLGRDREERRLQLQVAHGRQRRAGLDRENDEVDVARRRRCARRARRAARRSRARARRRASRSRRRRRPRPAASRARGRTSRCRRGSRLSYGHRQRGFGDAPPRLRVGHQRPRHDRLHVELRQRRRPRRRRARRSGPRSTTRRAQATCRRRAARASGRRGPSRRVRRRAGSPRRTGRAAPRARRGSPRTARIGPTLT